MARILYNNVRTVNNHTRKHPIKFHKPSVKRIFASQIALGECMTKVSLFRLSHNLSAYASSISLRKFVLSASVSDRPLKMFYYRQFLFSSCIVLWYFHLWNKRPTGNLSDINRQMNWKESTPFQLILESDLTTTTTTLHDSLALACFLSTPSVLMDRICCFNQYACKRYLARMTYKVPLLRSTNKTIIIAYFHLCVICLCQRNAHALDKKLWAKWFAEWMGRFFSYFALQLSNLKAINGNAIEICHSQMCEFVYLRLYL